MSLFKVVMIIAIAGVLAACASLENRQSPCACVWEPVPGQEV